MGPATAGAVVSAAASEVGAGFSAGDCAGVSLGVVDGVTLGSSETTGDGVASDPGVAVCVDPSAEEDNALGSAEALPDEVAVEDASVDAATLDAAPVGFNRCSFQLIEVVLTSVLTPPSLPKLESSGSLILMNGTW